MKCPVCGKGYERARYYDKSGRGRWRDGPIHTTCSRSCAAKIRFADRDGAFWNRVDKSGGEDACHPWKGYCNPKTGYGCVGRYGKVKKAHRVAYELCNGSIDESLDVLHSCDNPPCCNFKHLFQATHSDNMADMAAKGRSADKRGRSNGRAKLKEIEVRAIRLLWANGETQVKIARMFKVAQPTINQIVRRETWKHVE